MPTVDNKRLRGNRRRSPNRPRPVHRYSWQRIRLDASPHTALRAAFEYFTESCVVSRFVNFYRAVHYALLPSPCGTWTTAG